jgi:signal transduction histidine kinase/streptogramin lyase
LSHKTILSILEDRSGVLWIGTSGGLNQFDRKKEIFKHWINEPLNPSSISHNEVRSIYEDHLGNLWIGTFGGGLNQFDRKKEEFFHFKNRPDDPNSLSTDQILSIYEDQAGILWIGTYAGGINRLDREKSKFTHWVHKPGDRNSLNHNYVYSIYEDHAGILWVGTEGGGLNRITARDDKGSPSLFSHCLNNPDDSSSLSNNDVTSISEDRSGNLWIGTMNGLNKFDRESKKFTHWVNQPGDPHSLSNNSVLSIFEDSAGNLWIGTRRGLNKFDYKDMTFSHWTHDSANPQSISHDVIVSIFEDRSGVFWIGTGGGGLNKFDRRRGTFTHWKNEPGKTSSLSNNEILSIYEDQFGGLWIGTIGGGLNKFNRKEETFTRYKEDDGLPNEVIYGILEDDIGNLWLSTNKGISKFNLKSETFRNYDRLDGLQINEFNQGAFFKSKSRFYFGGINGFVSFVPESIIENQNIPPILITTFKVFDRIKKNDIYGTDEFKLSYKDKYYTFEFAALDYRNPAKNQYAYIMEGIDKDWIYSGTRRFTTYTNLPPGNYTFRVKGSNSDGLWNEKGVSLQITISPPFWQTWWFRVVALIFLLGIAFLGHKLRLRNIEVKKRILENTVRKRTTELEEKNRQLTDALIVLKDSQSQLAHSEKMAALGDLAAGITHEINTPIGALNSAADTSRRSIEKIINTLKECSDLHEIHQDKKFRAALDILKSNIKIKSQASERVIKIAQSLKDFARLDMKEFQEADINERIENTLTLLDHKFKNRISVVRDFEEIPRILCYSNQLTQVFMNIFTNASEAIKDKGTITIQTAREKDSIIVRISDNGVGIEEGNLEKIFNPGFTTKGVGVGTGLGLSISYRIIKAHKGEIEVRSEVGKGTDFILTLPINKQEKKQATNYHDDN